MAHKEDPKLPCKYEINGCLFMLSLEEKGAHEEVCQSQPFKCPFAKASCSWQGKSEDVVNHLLECHENVNFFEGEGLSVGTEETGPLATFIAQSDDQYFLLVVQQQDIGLLDKRFFVVLQIIGSKKNAEQYSYSLELRGNGRRLYWETAPCSSEDDVILAIMQRDCLVFDTRTMDHFGENRSLYIEIKPTSED